MSNKTLLNAINETLTRCGYIAGDAGLLTSLTDSARQAAIDLARQVINEGIDELYSTSGTPMPTEQAESTITLAATRVYTTAADMSQVRWPFIDKTNGTYIWEFSGGYDAMLKIDPRQAFTGLPVWATIRPTDGAFYTFSTPSAADVGKIYTYQYDKNLEFTLAADILPFGNPIFRAMVPVWAQLWKRGRRQEFDVALFKTDIGRACRLLTLKQPRDSWSPR